MHDLPALQHIHNEHCLLHLLSLRLTASDCRMPSLHAVDPGNWATDLAAGSAYGYDLLAAILLANICAIFLQVHPHPADSEQVWR